MTEDTAEVNGPGTSKVSHDDKEKSHEGISPMKVSSLAGSMTSTCSGLAMTAEEEDEGPVKTPGMGPRCLRAPGCGRSGRRGSRPLRGMSQWVRGPSSALDGVLWSAVSE